jgi:hypothetical protein
MRRKRVNKNSIPFLVLGVIHICVFLLLSKRKKQKGIWILLLSNIGFAYLFEYPTLNLFHGYQYKPKIMKRRIFDSILGAIFSQALYVPITATLLTIFNKNLKWKVGFGLLYFGIEVLFLQLKIYKLSWWRPIFTPILLNGYFFISDGFYKAFSAQKRWALALAHYLAVEVVWVTFMFFSAAKGYIQFGRGSIHTWAEHFKITPLYSLILSLIATFTASKSNLLHWIILPLSHISMDTLLIRTGLLKVKVKRIFVIITRYFLMAIFSKFFYKVIYKKDQKAIPKL